MRISSHLFFKKDLPISTELIRVVIHLDIDLYFQGRGEYR